MRLSRKLVKRIKETLKSKNAYLVYGYAVATVVSILVYYYKILPLHEADMLRAEQQLMYTAQACVELIQSCGQ